MVCLWVFVTVTEPSLKSCHFTLCSSKFYHKSWCVSPILLKHSDFLASVQFAREAVLCPTASDCPDCSPRVAVTGDALEQLWVLLCLSASCTHSAEHFRDKSWEQQLHQLCGSAAVSSCRKVTSDVTGQVERDKILGSVKLSVCHENRVWCSFHLQNAEFEVAWADTECNRCRWK